VARIVSRCLGSGWTWQLSINTSGTEKKAQAGWATVHILQIPHLGKNSAIGTGKEKRGLWETTRKSRYFWRATVWQGKEQKLLLRLVGSREGDGCHREGKDVRHQRKEVQVGCRGHIWRHTVNSGAACVPHGSMYLRQDIRRAGGKVIFPSTQHSIRNQLLKDDCV